MSLLSSFIKTSIILYSGALIGTGASSMLSSGLYPVEMFISPKLGFSLDISPPKSDDISTSGELLVVSAVEEVEVAVPLVSISEEIGSVENQ